MPAEPPQEEQSASPAATPGRAVLRLVVAARVALLLLAGALAVGGFVLLVREPATSARLYVCPMHPQVVAATPSDCPICGMALVQARPDVAVRAREVSPIRQQGAVETVRQRVLSRPVRAPASARGDGTVRALLYADEVAALAPAAAGVFVPAGAPGERSRVVRTSSAPEPVDGSSAWVDFRIEAAAPGAAGWVEIEGAARPVLVVPSTAVLRDPDGPYVLAAAGGEDFARRRVVVGRTVFGLTTIVEGLREGERVATRNAFFLDAEERLAGGGSPAPVQR